VEAARARVTSLGPHGQPSGHLMWAKQAPFVTQLGRE